jgi:putative SOS response-associated peptidase YedK
VVSHPQFQCVRRSRACPYLQRRAAELSACNSIELRNRRAGDRTHEVGPGALLVEDGQTQIQHNQSDADKLTSSGVWREPFKHRRCLVPADWFYEWPVVDGEKQARAFALKNDSPFAFAGIWDRWKDKETGEVLESFAIVTVDPSEWMAKYHDRMGVILKPKDYQRWLEEGEEHTLPLDLLRPYPEEEIKSWRVSDKVGNTRNNWAELIEPVPDDMPKREKASKHAKPKKESPPKGLFD